MSVPRFLTVLPVDAHHAHSPFVATRYIAPRDTEISPVQEFLWVAQRIEFGQHTSRYSFYIGLTRTLFGLRECSGLTQKRSAHVKRWAFE